MPTTFQEDEKKIRLLLDELKEEAHRLSDALVGFRKQRQEKEKIVLRDIQHIHILKVEEIIYCKAERSYTRFILSNGEAVLISKNLKTYERLLEPFGFFRSHHSYLINLNHLRRIDKQSKPEVVLSNQHLLPVSKSKRELLFQKIAK